MSARAAVLAAVLLSAGAAAAQGTGGVAAIYSVGAALDLSSTDAALRAGALEANPLMRGSTGKRAAIKAAQVAGVTLLDTKLKSKKAKWAVRIGWTLLHAYVARRNWSAR